MTPEEAREWLKRARRGDEVAFLRLVEATRDRLLRLAKRMTGREAVAEEILQESYFALWRTAGPIPDDPSAWLYKACLNRAIDISRREAIFREVPMEGSALPDDASPNPAEIAMTKAASDAMSEAAALLPPAERVVFALRAYEGFSFDEISRRLSISQSTARNQYMSARRRMALVLAAKGVTP
jgi:RNA polymerase sigma-70 factor (ECF subfamily)